MDRNGLRPARWTLTPDVVIVASEAGVCPALTATGVVEVFVPPVEDSDEGYVGARLDGRDWRLTEVRIMP